MSNVERAFKNAQGKRLFFDTNILLDLLDKNRPESDEACQVLKRCNGEGDMGLVSPMSLKDVYYVLCKCYDEAHARQAVGVLMGQLVIAPFSAEECAMSITSNEPDFEDGLIRACAELNDVDVILTRDTKAFKKSTIKAMKCSEYLALYE